MTEELQSKISELEAVLYASGRPITLTTLCAHLRLDDERQVSELIASLQETYEKDRSPLEIGKVSGGKVVLQLRPDYNRQAKKFSMKPPQVLARYC